MSIKRCLARFDKKNVYFPCFMCAACLPASLIRHVPISELYAQWHLCLHFHHASFNPIQRSCWWPISILVSL